MYDLQIPATGATCGNKILETGEDCDCGTVDECEADKCCDAITCKFAEYAECAHGPCCTNQCKVRCAVGPMARRGSVWCGD